MCGCYSVFAGAYTISGEFTDFLLKAGVDSETNYAPVLTAGERVELVSSDLIPPDQSFEPRSARQTRAATLAQAIKSVRS